MTPKPGQRVRFSWIGPNKIHDIEAEFVQLDGASRPVVRMGDTITMTLSHETRLTVIEPRASWHEYFLGIAQAVASRSTCPRKSVGAVLVRDRVIVSTGYNGSVRGDDHCIEHGCDLAKIDGRDSCQRVVHAEANAVAQAAQIGASIKGAAAYVTCSPCRPCFKLLVNAGITQVFFDEQFYRDGDRIAETAKRLGIGLEKI